MPSVSRGATRRRGSTASSPSKSPPPLLSVTTASTAATQIPSCPSSQESTDGLHAPFLLYNAAAREVRRYVPSDLWALLVSEHGTLNCAYRQTSIRVGRAGDCDTILRDPRVSSTHFTITLELAECDAAVKESSSAATAAGSTISGKVASSLMAGAAPSAALPAWRVRRVVLRDGSANGTYVNDVLVGRGHACQLHDGDDICVVRVSEKKKRSRDDLCSTMPEVDADEAEEAMVQAEDPVRPTFNVGRQSGGEEHGDSNREGMASRPNTIRSSSAPIRAAGAVASTGDASDRAEPDVTHMFSALLSTLRTEHTYVERFCFHLYSPDDPASPLDHAATAAVVAPPHQQPSTTATSDSAPASGYALTSVSSVPVRMNGSNADTGSLAQASTSPSIAAMMTPRSLLKSRPFLCTSFIAPITIPDLGEEGEGDEGRYHEARDSSSYKGNRLLQQRPFLDASSTALEDSSLLTSTAASRFHDSIGISPALQRRAAEDQQRLVARRLGHGDHPHGSGSNNTHRHAAGHVNAMGGLMKDVPADMPIRYAVLPLRHLQWGGRIGSGASGDVYMGIDVDTATAVAIKVLKGNTMFQSAGTNCEGEVGGGGGPGISASPALVPTSHAAAVAGRSGMEGRSPELPVNDDTLLELSDVSLGNSPFSSSSTASSSQSITGEGTSPLSYQTAEKVGTSTTAGPNGVPVQQSTTYAGDEGEEHVMVMSSSTSKPSTQPPTLAVPTSAFREVHSRRNLNAMAATTATAATPQTPPTSPVPSASPILRKHLREIIFLTTLHHHRIVRFLGFQFSAEGRLCLLMEYVAGGTLQTLIRNFGAFNENVIRVYTLQILEGMEYLARKGVVHGDLKSANILVSEQGSVKLTDFGTSRFFQPPSDVIAASRAGDGLHPSVAAPIHDHHHHHHQQRSAHGHPSDETWQQCHGSQGVKDGGGGERDEVHGALDDHRASSQESRSRSWKSEDEGEADEEGVDDGVYSDEDAGPYVEQPQQGVLCGTPLYMSPELIRTQEPTFASDIWSLGCVVFEMATGGILPWRPVHHSNVSAVIWYIGQRGVSSPGPSLEDVYTARRCLNTSYDPHLNEEGEAPEEDVFRDEGGEPIDRIDGRTPSRMLLSLLRSTLHMNAEARPSAAELLQHPFIRGERSVTALRHWEERVAAAHPISASHACISTSRSSGSSISNSVSGGSDEKSREQRGQTADLEERRSSSTRAGVSPTGLLAKDEGRLSTGLSHVASQRTSKPRCRVDGSLNSPPPSPVAAPRALSATLIDASALLKERKYGDHNADDNEEEEAMVVSVGVADSSQRTSRTPLPETYGRVSMQVDEEAGPPTPMTTSAFASAVTAAGHYSPSTLHGEEEEDVDTDVEDMAKTHVKGDRHPAPSCTPAHTITNSAAAETSPSLVPLPVAPRVHGPVPKSFQRPQRQKSAAPESGSVLGAGNPESQPLIHEPPLPPPPRTAPVPSRRDDRHALLGVSVSPPSAQPEVFTVSSSSTSGGAWTPSQPVSQYQRSQQQRQSYFTAPAFSGPLHSPRVQDAAAPPYRPYGVQPTPSNIQQHQQFLRKSEQQRLQHTLSPQGSQRPTRGRGRNPAPVQSFSQSVGNAEAWMPPAMARGTFFSQPYSAMPPPPSRQNSVLGGAMMMMGGGEGGGYYYATPKMNTHTMEMLMPRMVASQPLPPSAGGGGGLYASSSSFSQRAHSRSHHRHPGGGNSNGNTAGAAMLQPQPHPHAQPQLPVLGESQTLQDPPLGHAYWNAQGQSGRGRGHEGENMAPPGSPLHAAQTQAGNPTPRQSHSEGFYAQGIAPYTSIAPAHLPNYSQHLMQTISQPMSSMPFTPNGPVDETTNAPTAANTSSPLHNGKDSVPQKQQQSRVRGMRSCTSDPRRAHHESRRTRQGLDSRQRRHRVGDSLVASAAAAAASSVEGIVSTTEDVNSPRRTSGRLQHRQPTLHTRWGVQRRNKSTGSTSASSSFSLPASSLVQQQQQQQSGEARPLSTEKHSIAQHPASPLATSASAKSSTSRNTRAGAKRSTKSARTETRSSVKQEGGGPAAPPAQRQRKGRGGKKEAAARAAHQKRDRAK